MTDIEKAALERRIDALCAEVERLKQQNAMLRELENIRISQVKYCEDLDAENSKLRDERERLFHANVEKNGEVLRLVSENAKLRKLVRDMMRYYFMPSAIDSKKREAELLERAHELGVEEDDGELGVEVWASS